MRLDSRFFLLKVESKRLSRSFWQLQIGSKDQFSRFGRYFWDHVGQNIYSHLHFGVDAGQNIYADLRFVGDVGQNIYADLRFGGIPLFFDLFEFVQGLIR